MAEMYDNASRVPAFRRDPSVEARLRELNSLIRRVPMDCREAADKPIVLIMGCARAGSTLMMQFLASLGIFSYPSNLIARFYANPYVGLLTQRVLFECGSEGSPQATGEARFESSLGKTRGLLEPNEFWYFWRQYFRFGEIERLSAKELQAVAHGEFLNKLYSFAFLTGKPLVLKGMMLNNHLPYLSSINPRFVFVHLRRATLYNAQSLLLAREKFFGDRRKWYSFKPVEYDEVASCGPLEQVVRQVVCANRAVASGLRSVPPANRVDITYEEFCADPAVLLDKLASTPVGDLLPPREDYTARCGSYPCRNARKLSEAEFGELAEHTTRWDTAR